MGTQALEFLKTLTPAILSIAGVCAAVAIVAAVIRHFMYEHGSDDYQPLAKRFTHVFGFLAAIGFVSIGGVRVADRIASSNAISGVVTSKAGSSLLPEQLSGGSKSASNLGDLLMGTVKGNPEHMSQEEASDVTKNAMENPGGESFDSVVKAELVETNKAGSTYGGG